MARVEKKKILIVGGNGFIGSWLSNLLKSSCRVISFDIQKKFSSYPEEKAARIMEFRKKLLKGVKQYKGDIRNFSLFSRILNNEKPNVIVCLSSIPIEGFPDENLQLETEVMGISNILRANKELDAKVVFMSSLFAIGHFDHAVTENSHLAPVTNYGIGKATGEHLVRTFAKKYGIIRTTSLYGLGDVINRAPQIIMERALEGGDKNLWINKAPLLDFIYVKDLVEGIKRVIFHKNNETFNISGGKALTLIDFVKTVESCTGKKIDYEVRSVNDRTRRGTLVNDKARLVLNWQPRYDLASGIKETLRLYHEHILTKKI